MKLKLKTKIKITITLLSALLIALCGIMLLTTAEKVSADEYDFSGTTGLAYTYDSTNYTASVAGIGSATDTELVIPKFVSYNDAVYTVTEIAGERDGADGAFAENMTLTSVVIPGTVKTIGFEAFDHCENITSITIENGVERILEYAFYKVNIETLNIPDSVVEIQQAAFKRCVNLETVTIGNGVVTMGSIAPGATLPGQVFFECTALESVTIGTSISEIKYRTFYGCTALTDITIKAPTPPTIDAESIPVTVENIKVPYSSLIVYRSASVFSGYTSSLTAITASVTYMDGETELTALAQVNQSTLNLPSAPPKNGYKFKGWYTDSAFTVKAVSGASLTENTVLYARYLKINSAPIDSNQSENVGCSNSFNDISIYLYIAVGVLVLSFAFIIFKR